LKATKGLRRDVELYNRGGYRQSVATKNLHHAAKHKVIAVITFEYVEKRNIVPHTLSHRHIA